MWQMGITMSASGIPADVVSAGRAGEPGRRRWFVLGVVGLAQLMIVLDITIMNIALPPAALGMLTTTFSDRRDRGRAFGVYGAIAGGGGLVGLLLGGLLTEYLDWRWCLYVNLIFAAVAVAGASILLTNQRAAQTPRLDYFGVAAVSGSMFCLVYGFSNAATHSWSAGSTWGWLAAGVFLLIVL